MSQFAQSGSAMDDAQASDGDGGFVGVNQRLQLNQLEVGEVRESLNGRMDGYWKPRRGVVARTGALVGGGSPLQLPFFLIDSAKTISNAAVSLGVVTLTVTGHGLTVGETGVANVSGLAGNAEMNGNFALTVTGANTLTYSVSGLTAISDTAGFLNGGSINDGADADVRASCLFSDPNSGNAESVVLALGSKAILVDLDGYGTEDVSYPTGKALAEDVDLIQAFDRVFLFRDGQQGFEWFPNGRQIEGASQSGSVVTVTLKDHGLSVGDSVEITGLTGGTPMNGTYPVASVPTKDTFTYSSNRIVVTGTLVPNATGTYLPSTQVGNPFPFWEKTPGAGGASIYYDNTVSYWVLLMPTLPGFASWRSSSTTDLNVLNATGWVPYLNVVAPPATGTPVLAAFTQTQTFGVTNAVLKAGFTLAPAGDYTQPQTFIVAGGNVSASNGLVTIDKNTLGNTTITKGDTIVIYETTIDEFSSISGKQFEVFSANTTTITFYAPVGTKASFSGNLEFGGRFSVGGGFIHQPAPPWGVYFQRRLWVPFYYTPAGTFSSPTYTDRKITDEIAISDILDSHTFDQIANQFRITGGTTDYLVAMQGFYDDSLVVLNRNSLHLISGTAGSLTDTKVTQLTTEVGCLAKKSVVMKGNAMFFLSDDGVYAVEFLNDYNLRGADEPISKNIQPYIDRINKNLAAEAVGVLFNNRYYLAVALDSSAGANNATGNNTILIFNFLNKAWESIDTFNASDFIIKNLIIGSAAERDSIYAVTSLGGLHELEAVESSNDNLVSAGLDASFPITSSLTTRGYALGNLDRKRFTDGQLTMQCVGGGLGEYAISFAAEDPDNNQSIGTTTTFLGGTVLGTGAVNEDETGNIRFRLGGIRGYVGSLTLTRTIGSPKITSIKVTGSVTNRQIISQS
jgi:hypothetical protein